MRFEDSSAGDDDEARKPQIEGLMRTDRPRYFRDELMQQEYRDILERQIAQQAESEADTKLGAATLASSGRAQDASEDHSYEPIAKPVQLASNNVDLVPKIPPPKVNNRLLSLRGQIEKDEAVWGRGDSGDQQADPKPELVRLAQNAQSSREESNRESSPNEWKKHPFEELIEKDKTINAIIDREARAAGVNPRWLKIIAWIESAGDPNLRTGSYLGLFQFGEGKWQDLKMRGARQDATVSTKAAIAEFDENRKVFLRRMGREPTLGEIYLMHQQGQAGGITHIRNPHELAWLNLVPTAGSEAKAKERIRANLPTHLRGNDQVNRMTSQEFMDYWLKRVEGGEGYGNWFVAFPATPTPPMKGVAKDRDQMPFDTYSGLWKKNQIDRSRLDGWMGDNDGRRLSTGRDRISTDLMLRNANKSLKWPR